MPINMWLMLYLFCVFQADFNFLRFEVATGLIYVCVYVKNLQFSWQILCFPFV